jgi:hypothetical protein
MLEYPWLQRRVMTISLRLRPHARKCTLLAYLNQISHYEGFASRLLIYFLDTSRLYALLVATKITIKEGHPITVVASILLRQVLVSDQRGSMVIKVTN